MALKNDCEQIRMQISAFLDNELGSGDAIRVAHHLEMCVPCRHEYDQTRTVRDTLRSLPVPSPSVSAAAKELAFTRLENALRQPPVPARQSLWKQFLSPGMLRPLAASMAMAVVAGMTFMLWPDAEITVPDATVGSVSPPTIAEWDNLFHRHDAQSLSFSADDPTLRRDTAAEAHASLLRQADDEVASSL